MRVVYQDGNLLQLRPKGGWLILLIGALMFASTPVWLLVFGQTTALTCERTPSEGLDCRLSRSLFGIATTERPLEALRGARVSESTDSDGDTMYQVILETDGGDIPLTNHRSSSYRPKAAQVEEINRFLADARTPAMTVTAGGTVGWIVTGVLMLIGAAMVIGGIQTSSTVWTFDRGESVIVKRRGGLISPRTWQYDLREMAGAVVTSSRDSDGDRTYRVELLTHRGQNIPMTGWYSSGYQAKERTAHLIQSFMDQA